MLNDNLFGQTYDQISKAILGASSQNFQMIVAPIPFSFLTAGPGQMDPATYQILSQMPVWSPTATFGQDGTPLFSAYRQLLANVTFKVDVSKQADLQAQASQINDFQRQITQASADTTQAYNVSVNNGGAVFLAQFPTINDWLAGPGSTFTEKVKVLANTVKELADKYAGDLASLQGDASLAESLEACKKPAGQPSSGVSKAGWVAVPDSGGTLQWLPEFTLNKSPSDVRQDLARGTVGGFTTKLSSATSSSSMQHSWAGGSASRGVPFFSINMSGSWDKLDIDESDQSVDVEIGVASSMTDLVSPGVWYNAGFLKNLAQNKQGAGYQLASGWKATGGPPNAAFGKDGLVSAMVASLVLVSRPRVTITMSASTYQRNQQKIGACGGISIGPFSFGGSGGRETDFKRTTNGTTSYTFESTSTDPQIIGVSVGFPGGVGAPSA